MQNYSTLHHLQQQETNQDQEESGVLIHVAEPSRARWNHIDDLDSFFSRMYRYHQRHGFLCMLLQEVFELIQFLFVVSFTTFLLNCVNYPVLFNDVKVARNSSTTTNKVTLNDVIYSVDECKSNFGFLTWFSLVTALIIWLLRLVRGAYHLIYFWEIKQFYNLALNINDTDLDNLTWHEIQTRIRTVQLEQQMCIHKKELTELDIYHRILRQNNYLVAMTNKRLLPPRIKVPFFGEFIYWTRGLMYNVKFLLFRGPRSPFQNPWHLRDEYRKLNNRMELAKQMGNIILWLALANLLLAPLIFLWQILYAFFNYAELIKREPGSLGVRNWSLYGRLYLRHFNELEHELQARLSRAHKPATNYLNSFTSPIATVIAKSVGFMVGAVLAVLILLTVYDEDVLAVEHVLTLITILGGCVAISRALIPDETILWCPKTLLSNVLIHTHYLPNGWIEQAHTSAVRKEFQQLFQLRVVGLLEELFSPLITPYVLYRHVYPRSLDIVDFYRNFTVSVVGVGDVCSFAQMDLRKHGNPDWQLAPAAGNNVRHDKPRSPSSSTHQHGAVDDHGQTRPFALEVPDQYTQAEDGKVELSLVHFAHTNPNWRPTIDKQKEFVETVERESLLFSTNSCATNMQQQLQQPYNSLSYHQQQQFVSGGDYMLRANLADSSSIRSDAYRCEGPLNTMAAYDMSLSTMYLHDRHHNNNRVLTTTSSSRRLTNTGGRQPIETTPLLSSSN